MNHNQCCPPYLSQQVVDPPVQVYDDVFHPLFVQVIQPVEIIRRHHYVPVPHQVLSITEKDVCCIHGVKKRRRR